MAAADVTDAIRRIGRAFNPDTIQASAAVMAPRHGREPYAGVTIARDFRYGDHERHRLDVFRADDRAGEPRPVFLFVHGGGFVGGDKHNPGSPFNDHMGVWAARNGMIGVTITYRLAPQHVWPAGAEDLSAAVEWVRAHIGEHGGDPSRVFLGGTSAGAVHVGSYLAGDYGAAEKVRGAVLLSPLFDAPTCERNDFFYAYYGQDEGRRAEQSILKGVVESPVPVLVTMAEFDPVDFQRQALKYVDAYFERHGLWPNFIRLPGHNHVTASWHVGSDDDYFAGQMLDFMRYALEK